MEKIISKKTIEEKIKNEYKAGRDWCKGDQGRYYKMMLDTSDASVWSDVFFENEYKTYHSNSIECLYHDAVPFSTIPEIEQGYINNAIRSLKKAGWEITE